MVAHGGGVVNQGNENVLYYELEDQAPLTNGEPVKRIAIERLVSSRQRHDQYRAVAASRTSQACGHTAGERQHSYRCSKHKHKQLTAMVEFVSLYIRGHSKGLRNAFFQEI